MAGRITRKELKTDKFALEVEHTVDFVTEHRRALALYGSLAAAAAVIAVGAYFYIRHQHMLREQALGDAIQIQETPSARKLRPPLNFPTEEAKRGVVSKAFSEIIQVSRYQRSGHCETLTWVPAADQGKMPDAATLSREPLTQATKTTDRSRASHSPRSTSRKTSLPTPKKSFAI